MNESILEKSILEEVSLKFEDGKLDFNEFVEIILLLMQKVEKMKIMSGSSKKRTVLAELMKLISSYTFPEKEYIIFFIENILPPIINLFIDFDKNIIKINEARKKLRMLCCK